MPKVVHSTLPFFVHCKFANYIGKLDPDYSGNKENLANDMVSFFGSLTPDQVKAIKTVKKDDAGNDKEQVLKNTLNDLYSSFKEKQELKQTA